MARKSNQAKSAGGDWTWGLLLVLAVIVTYIPVTWAGFVWDDTVYVTNNPVIVGPLGLKEIWTTRAADVGPLTMTTFWFEYALWGASPLPFHLVNVLFHAASAIVLWRVLRIFSVPGAWLGAALWALHPVLVESVAWISELKNAQATFFYLLSIFFLAKWLKDKTRRNVDYGLMLLFAALAIASKSSTVILPLVLGLGAWWIQRRIDWPTLLRIAPTLLFSAASIALSVWTEPASDVAVTRTWAERFIVAGDAIWFYLGKLIWPYPLLTVYPQWKIDSADLISYLPLVAALALFILLWFKRDTWARPWFFAFSYFVIALFPVLGFVEHPFLHYSYVADHFQNLACMGPLALLGAATTFLLSARRELHAILSSVLLLILAALSWSQATLYQNQMTLWTYNVAWNPNCWVGYTSLGFELAAQNQLDAALLDYQKAVELNPGFAEAQNELGTLLVQTGRGDEALPHFQKAIEDNPRDPAAYTNLAVVLAQKGEVAAAIEQFQKSLAIDPNQAGTHADLGLLFAKSGRLAEAITEFQEVLRLKPNDPDTQANLTRAQAMLKQQAGQK